MKLVNFSRFAFINENGLNIPKFFVDETGDFAYEAFIIPLLGFDVEDYIFMNGKVFLKSDFEIFVSSNEVFFKKSSSKESTQKVALLYSFKKIHDGEFSKYISSVAPDKIYKYTTGNHEEGYYHDILVILDPNIVYEILYHSETLYEAFSLKMHWEPHSQFLTLVPKRII